MAQSMTPARRSCQALCRPAHATATTSDARSSPVSLCPTPHHSAPNLCHIGPTPSAASSHETSPKYAWPSDSSPAEAHEACRCRLPERYLLVHLQALRVQHLIQASFRLRIQRLHKTKAFAGGCLVCFILSKTQCTLAHDDLEVVLLGVPVA